MTVKYSYRVAATSSATSPCSNVPIQCPVCPNNDPAVWRYSLKAHFINKHKTLTATGKYDHLWKLSNFEITEMKKIWAKRASVTAKRTRKSKLSPLVVSEDHRAQIPNRYRVIDGISLEQLVLTFSAVEMTIWRTRKTRIPMILRLN